MEEEDNIVDFPSEEQTEVNRRMISAVDQAPEDAAKAKVIEKQSGIPAPVVMTDLERYEKNHKIALTSHMLKSDEYLRSFVLADPVAAALANEDYEKLADAFGEAKKYIQKSQDPLYAYAARSAYEGLGQFTNYLGYLAGSKALREAGRKFSEFGRSNLPISNPELLDWRQKTAMMVGGLIPAGIATGIGSLFPPLLGAGVGTSLFALTAGMQSAGEHLEAAEAKDASEEAKATAATEAFGLNTLAALIQFGGIHRLAQAGRLGNIAIGGGSMALLGEVQHAANQLIAAENYDPKARYHFDPFRVSSGAILGMMFGALHPAVKPYAEAGKSLPPGIVEAFDKIRMEIAKSKLDDFEAAVRKAQASEARGLSPETFANALRQHTQEQIGVDAEAIRKLYGDEVPWEGDNKLGRMIPDLAAKLEGAEGTGGFIKVDLADWVAHATPEIQEALREDLKLDHSGLSLREAEALKEHWQVREAPREPDGPVGDPAIWSVRRASGTGWDFVGPSEAREPVFTISSPRPFKIRGELKLGQSIGSTTVSQALRESAPDIGVLKDFAGVVSKAINKFAGDVPVYVVDEATFAKDHPGSTAAAYYDPLANRIIMHEDVWRNHQYAARILWHEAVHAATSRVLVTNPEMAQKIKTLMYHVSRLNPELTSTYGFKNPHEFLAELFTKPAFQQELLKLELTPEIVRTLQLPPETTNVFQAIFRMIADLLGIPREKYTAFEAGIRLGIEAMEKGVSPEGMQAIKEKQAKLGIHEAPRKGDLGAAIERERAKLLRRKSSTWRQALPLVRQQVEEDLRKRPDIAVGELFFGRNVGGERVPQILLDSRALTPEQREALPKSIQGQGLHPDSLAEFFGFETGNDMVDALAETAKAKGERSWRDYKEEIISDEVDRRMEAEYGLKDELGWAKDHILSPAQLQGVYDKLVAIGMKAGIKAKFSIKEIRAKVKARFSDIPVRMIDSDWTLSKAGDLGRQGMPKLEKGDYKSAYDLFDRQQLALHVSRESIKFEREKEKAEEMFARRAKTEQEGLTGEWLNWIHYALERVGVGLERSPENLAEALAGSDHASFADFVKYQTEELREKMFIPDFMLDPNFRKNLNDLTVGEFRAVRDAIKSMTETGRRQNKVFKGEQEANFERVRDGMVEEMKSMRTLFKRVRPIRAEGQWRIGDPIRALRAAALTVESLLNRLDRDNPMGLFNQYIIRGLQEAGSRYPAVIRKYQAKMREALGDIVDLNRKVEQNIFRHPDTGEAMPFTHANVLGVLQAVGNPSSLAKMAKGWNVEPEHLLNWLYSVTEKADWDRAQRIGNILEELFQEVEARDQRVFGIKPERNPIIPFETPYGRYSGWHNPVRYSREIPGRRKAGPVNLQNANFYRPTTSQKYLEPRTPYIAPTELTLDVVPRRMNEMIHDLVFYEPITQANKFFYDPKFQSYARRFLGKHVEEQFKAYVKDIANRPFYDTEAQRWAGQAINFLRANTITGLIGLNLRTVGKHSTTAAVNSLHEEKLGFAKELATLFSTSDETLGESNWTFARTNSNELARRMDNILDVLRLEGPQIEMVKSSPRKAMEAFRAASAKIGTAPIGFTDLATAVPTWLSAYKRAIRQGQDHDTAVFLGDRAVRRAHGSSIITNQAMIARGNPMARLFTSLYNFFSHMLQKHYELAWKAKDAVHGMTEGNLDAAKQHAWTLTSGLVAYYIFPAWVEETITPYTFGDKDSLGMKMAKSLGLFTAGTVPIVRDLAHAVLNHREPGVGLISTDFLTLTNVAKELSDPKKYWNKQHAGKTIKDTLTLVSFLTGLGNAQIGRSAEWLWRYNHGLEPRPKYMFYPKEGASLTRLLMPGGPETWATALTKGSLLRERRR